MNTSILLQTTIDDRAEYNWHRGPFRSLKASLDRQDNPHIVAAASPESADLIIFTDPGIRPFQEDILRSDIWRRFKHKCFVLDPSDRAFPILPGLYASLEHVGAIERRTEGGLYFIDTDDGILKPGPATTPKHLFSFVGSVINAPVRKAIRDRLSQEGVVIDSSGKVIPSVSSGDANAIKSLRDQFHTITGDSAFVLCPGGKGSGSVRLFETMQMARAPVIISDKWVPPVGPDWDSFSIRVSEKDVSLIPAILKQELNRSREMGMLARMAYEQWFAPETRLSWAVGRFTLMLTAGRVQKFRHRWILARMLTDPYHVRSLIRAIRRR